GVRIKLNVLRENIDGRRIILVDDSIIRGTTIKRIVNMLRDAGAKEVHVRISSPPVIHSCHLGMDTPNRKNLIAAKLGADEMKKQSGADSFNYLSLEGALKSAGKDSGFCTGCFTGNYPIKRS